MAIRVEDVGDVLRSDSPQRASRNIALAILTDAFDGLGGTHASLHLRLRALARATRFVRVMPTTAIERDDEHVPLPASHMVTPDSAVFLLRREVPRSEATEVAVDQPSPCSDEGMDDGCDAIDLMRTLERLQPPTEPSRPTGPNRRAEKNVHRLDSAESKATLKNRCGEIQEGRPGNDSPTLRGGTRQAERKTPDN